MRGGTEIDAEVKALATALAKPNRWNAQARKTIEHSIRVLRERMSAESIEQDYYVDETMEDYAEDDNDLYNELMRVRAWMDAEKGYAAPSETL